MKLFHVILILLAVTQASWASEKSLPLSQCHLLSNIDFIGRSLTLEATDGFIFSIRLTEREYSELLGNSQGENDLVDKIAKEQGFCKKGE